MLERARQPEVDIQRRIDAHEPGKLFTTIRGVNTLTAVATIAEPGDPARFPNSAAFASYGVVPRAPIGPTLELAISTSQRGRAWRSISLPHTGR
jgi:hypothetical protein